MSALAEARYANARHGSPKVRRQGYRMHKLKTIDQGWPTSQTKSHISYGVTAKAESHTWAHMNITPSLPQSHITQIQYVNITNQHNNDRTWQGIYCYACYLVGLLVIT